MKFNSIHRILMSPKTFNFYIAKLGNSTLQLWGFLLKGVEKNV